MSCKQLGYPNFQLPLSAYRTQFRRWLEKEKEEGNCPFSPHVPCPRAGSSLPPDPRASRTKEEVATHPVSHG